MISYVVKTTLKLRRSHVSRTRMQRAFGSLISPRNDHDHETSMTSILAHNLLVKQSGSKARNDRFSSHVTLGCPVSLT